MFTVHLPPADAPGEGEPLLLREGFSWGAAVFGVFWALYFRCWRLALLLGLAGIALGAAVVFAGAGETAFNICSIGYAAIAGFCARDWRRAALERDGWRPDSIVAGRDPDEAMVRWLDRRATPPAGMLAPTGG